MTAEAGDPDLLNAETLDPEQVIDSGAVPGPADTAGDATAASSLSPEAEAPEPKATPAATDLGKVSEATDGGGATPAASTPTAVAPEPTPAELRQRERRLRDYMHSVLDALIAEYDENDRGLEIREVAGGFRFATKPEYHDAVRGFVRSLKPPLKLSLQALETLAVVAYKQPVTAPEVSEIRGVDSGGVLGGLMTRKLVTTAGRKQVIGRPILYKTTKEFLLRFGLKDLAELPSIEEFERLASNLNEAGQEEIPMAEPFGDAARPAGFQGQEHEAQADGIPDTDAAPPADDERLTRPTDGPGEFTGDETVAPVDNASIDGRIAGVPPNYDDAGNPSVHDADMQAEQAENQGQEI